MTDRDFEKVLADLRLYREGIEETILTLDRLIANHKKAAFLSWLKRAVPRA